jgi:hypothetical protein
MYILSVLAGSAILVFFGLDYLASLLLVCTIALALAHAIFIIESSYRRSDLYHRMATKFGLDYTEAQLSPWKFISVDPAKGDRPFVLRTIMGRVSGRYLSFSDVKLSGAFLHPWWYRSVPSFSMRYLGFFGISVATIVSIDGRPTIMRAPFSPWLDNAFASQGQIEGLLLRLGGSAVTGAAHR